MRILIVLITFLTLSSARAQPAATSSSDVDQRQRQRQQEESLVTEHLFKQYIANRYRIETDQVRSAVVLVADRGLSSQEFVQRILKEFDEACEEKNGRAGTFVNQQSPFNPVTA